MFLVSVSLAMPINDRYSWDFCLNVLQSESTFCW
uniref:Uncharacterized protein n=1 Tax=Anguilla anguilla TaxID=7936 RepID=A0A0E9TIE6_ANGAN